MPLIAGRYRLGAPIGHGGTATVHRGFDSSLRRPVAIKLVSRPDVDCLTTPLTEARAAARLTHPNVARIYDFGETTTGGTRAQFLVMEYLPEGTLADRLKSDGPLALVETAAIAADVAAALAAAHRQGIVHRDVKPKNVMLARGGAKLVDFGVAASAGEKPVDAGGRVWGTPAYSAPEQLQGEPTLPAADVYALGVLLHECLTGTSPWPGTSPEQVLVDRHLRPVPALSNPRDYPAEFVRLHTACLSPLPGRRPTAAEAARVLRRLANGRHRLRRPAPDSAGSVLSRASAARALALACAAAAVALLGLAIAQHTPADPDEAGPTPPVATATAPDETPAPGSNAEA